MLYTQKFIDSIRINMRAPIFASSNLAMFDSPVLNVDKALKKSCEVLLQELLNVTGHQKYDALISQLLFTSLLLKLHHERPNRYGNELSEERVVKFSRFLALVEKHFATVKDANKYADMIGMTYKSLNQLCKLAANQTPKQLIDAHIILEAKRRLAIENIQVMQLAYQFGFEDPSNFIKYFKKETRLTPHQFKKSLKG